jgi:hypothetical protein
VTGGLYPKEDKLKPNPSAALSAPPFGKGGRGEAKLTRKRTVTNCHCERSAAISGNKLGASKRLPRRLSPPRNDKLLIWGNPPVIAPTLKCRNTKLKEI